MDKEIEKEKNSAPGGWTPSETREERGTDGAKGRAAAGGSLCLRMG